MLYRFVVRNCSVISLGLLLSCGGSGGTVSTTVDAPAPVPPIASGPEFAVTLRPKLQRILQESLVPGAGVFLRTPQGDWTASFGVRALGSPVPVTAADHWRAGSCTKPMVGTVVLQMVDEGLLSLQDPISRFVENVPNGDSISITHLLEMRSGLYDYTEDPSFLAEVESQKSRVWSGEELLAVATSHPREFAPGQRFGYSNTNFILLGMVVEKLSGSSLGEELDRRLFRSQKLAGLSYPQQASSSLPEPFSHGYMYSDLVGFAEGLNAQEKASAYSGVLQPHDWTNFNPSFLGAAGAVVARGDDLCDFTELLVDGGYLSSGLQAQRLASLRTILDRPEEQYGWALEKVGSFVGHGGELPGYSTFMGRDHHRDITVVVWANLSRDPEGRSPALRLLRAISEELR